MLMGQNKQQKQNNVCNQKKTFKFCWTPHIFRQLQHFL